MSERQSVASHYTHGALIDAIREGVARLGKTPATLSVDDLGPVEEFHIGGRAATENFLDQLCPGPDDHILDIGCGIGGASRFVAYRYGARITGIDLTQEYVDTGNTLSAWLGLEPRVSLHQGSAIATTFADASFDKAYMMHVGMNIEEKDALFAEIYRVLKPGAACGVFDVMRTGEGELKFPVPWAATPAQSAVSTAEEYRAALSNAGFTAVTECNRRDFALDFFAKLKAAAAAAEGPPPLGLHILMGETAPVKVRNMIENISENLVAPVELIARKSA